METIRSNDDISSLFEDGRRVSGGDVLLIVNTSHQNSGRAAFVAGKKNGGAVWRNKAKRRMREAARFAGGPWKGLDVVFVAKQTTTTCQFSSLVSQIEGAISSL